MMKRWAAACTSIRKSVLFWWILFVVMQTAERVFLLRDALEQETPTWPLLTKTQGESGQRGFSVARDRDLMALYEVANVALDSNRLWSWREFGSRL